MANRNAFHNAIKTNLSGRQYVTYLSIFVDEENKLCLHIADRIEDVPEYTIATSGIGKLDDNIISELKSVNNINTIVKIKGL